jgi:hypothetical protein
MTLRVKAADELVKRTAKKIVSSIHKVELQKARERIVEEHLEEFMRQLTIIAKSVVVIPINPTKGKDG